MLIKRSSSMRRSFSLRKISFSSSTFLKFGIRLGLVKIEFESQRKVKNSKRRRHKDQIEYLEIGFRIRSDQLSLTRTLRKDLQEKKVNNRKSLCAQEQEKS